MYISNSSFVVVFSLHFYDRKHFPPGCVGLVRSSLTEKPQLLDSLGSFRRKHNNIKTPGDVKSVYSETTSFICHFR